MLLLISVGPTLILVAYIGRFLLEYVKNLLLLWKVPTPSGFNFVTGHAHILKSDPAEFYKQTLQYCNEFKNDHIFIVWIGPRPMIVCNHPSAVETVLGSNEVITKSMMYTVLERWIGRGLLTSTGEKWKSRRKLLTPAFHFSMLQSYVSIINKHARQLTDVVKERIFSTEEENPSIDIFPLIVSSTLDVICEAAMSYNLNSLTNCDQQYATAIKRMTDIVMQRIKFPHLFFDFIFYRTALGREHERLLKIIHSFTSGVIKERLQEMKEANVLNEINLGEMSNRKKWKLAFLDLLLHEQHVNGTLTDSDIQEEVDTFMFEGHDTTAVAITWCLFNIGCSPTVQAKVHEELDAVFPVGETDVSYEHIGRLQYLDKVIKESLRLFPSVPFFAREVTTEFTLNNQRMPIGSTIAIVPAALHRNPHFFTDPEKFYPERFDEPYRHPYSYVPFSAGPRNCIGAKFAQMEIKIILSWFLRRYRIKSLQKMNECHPAGDIILKPIRGVFINVQNRDR